MKKITTTAARKHISDIVDEVSRTGTVFGIGRRGRTEALVIRYPENYNQDLGEATNLNAYSTSFDFLNDEKEDVYRVDDLTKRYV